MMKRVHVVLIIVAAVAVLGVGVWYFAIWSVKGAFESAAQQGFEPLAGVLKATVGGTIARGDIRFELNSGAESSGAIDLYRNNPQALQRDKEYFDTWSSAMAIARETLQRGHQFTKWQSSQNLAWIPPPHRTDGWGHAFCVKSDQQHTILVSPGPQALSSLDCSTLKLSDDERENAPGEVESPLSIFGG